MALPFPLLFEVIITDSRFPCITPKASSLPFSYFHLSLWMRHIKTEFVFKGEEKKALGHLRLQRNCLRCLVQTLCRKWQTKAKYLQIILPLHLVPPFLLLSNIVKSLEKVWRIFLSLPFYQQWEILSICFLLLKHQMQGKHSTMLHSRYMLTYCHKNSDYFAVDSDYCS